MEDLKDIQKHCPYCGECIGIEIDISAGSQTYFEDCSVCCRPIYIDINVESPNNVKVIFRTDSA